MHEDKNQMKKMIKEMEFIEICDDIRRDGFKIVNLTLHACCSPIVRDYVSEESYDLGDYDIPAPIFHYVKIYENGEIIAQGKPTLNVDFDYKYRRFPKFRTFCSTKAVFEYAPKIPVKIYGQESDWNYIVKLDKQASTRHYHVVFYYEEEEVASRDVTFVCTEVKVPWYEHLWIRCPSKDIRSYLRIKRKRNQNQE